MNVVESPEHTRYQLERPSGLRLNIPPAGLAIGRHFTCNIVLSDSRAGRLHALVRPDDMGLKLFVTGSNPVLLGSTLVDRWASISPGATLQFPGETITVHGAATPTASSVWFFARDEEASRTSKSSFTVGGDPLNDLVVPGWPAGAVRFAVRQGALLANFATAARVGRTEVAPGVMTAIEPGQSITINATAVSVFREVHGETSATVAWLREPPPTRIELDTMRSGARLTLKYPDLTLVLSVPELAARLLLVLLRPPPGFQPGDLIPDNLVMDQVWPHSPRRDAAHLERLLARVRQELSDRGVNPLRLLGRQPSAGALRVILGRDTEVAVAAR